MKKERLIKITDIQYEDGEKQEIELTTWGTLSGSDEDYVITFEEIFAEDMKALTKVSVKNKSCVSIVRRGDISTEITVEKGKRHSCHYSTPYGDMMLGIHANQIDSQINSGGGKLKLVYTVDYYANISAVKEMIIEIGE